MESDVKLRHKVVKKLEALVSEDNRGKVAELNEPGPVVDADERV